MQIRERLRTLRGGFVCVHAQAEETSRAGVHGLACPSRRSHGLSRCEGVISWDDSMYVCGFWVCRLPDGIPVILRKRKFLEDRATRTAVLSDFLKTLRIAAQFAAAGSRLDRHSIEPAQSAARAARWASREQADSRRLTCHARGNNFLRPHSPIKARASRRRIRALTQSNQ